jgi:hypothetical protein
MNRAEITQFANNDPQFSKAVDMMEEQLAQQPIVPEDMDELILFLEKILEDPSRYAEMRDAAIADGEIDEGMLPPQFNMIFVVSLLVALYGVQDRIGQRGYSRGGLKVAARRIAAEGRNGDNILAHINPGEAQMLQRMGGSGSINPTTGLPEFFKFNFGSILAAIAPIALSFIAPGIGTYIGGAISGALELGLGAAATSAVGAGVLGAGASILGGAKLPEALMSGLFGGAAQYALGAGGLNIAGAIPGVTPDSDLGPQRGGSPAESMDRRVENNPITPPVVPPKTDWTKLAPLGVLAASALSSPSGSPTANAPSMGSPDKGESFNRTMLGFNYAGAQKAANDENMSLTAYLNQPGNYEKFASGAPPVASPTAFVAQGGTLNQISNLARGSGSGRDDTINARLSDGEYIMDAETVALLGDGSNSEGARRLNQMRKEIRAQKGKSLARGKFSPDAKSPLAYLKGAA